MHHDLEVFSAAHGFYNQSPELANFLRGQFLQGEEVDDPSGSGSHPRVLTPDGAISEMSQPIEVIERTDSSKKAVPQPPAPALPAVAQQVVAQARDAIKPPPRPALHEEDDTYQAPPLSEEFLQEAAPAKAQAAHPKGERPSESSQAHRRAEPTGPGASTASVATAAKSETRDHEPSRRIPAKPAAPAPVEEPAAVQTKETKKPPRRAPVKEPEPVLEEEEEAPEEEEELEEAEEAEEEWEEEWEEAEEAPRSSAVVAALAVVLVLFLGAVGGIGFYVARAKGWLPPSWLSPGRIVVQTLPEAKVFLDGEMKGTADASGAVTIKGVTGGQYDLKISKAGYADWTKNDIRIRPNKGYPVSAYLEPLRGQLKVSANEPGARVYVGGAYYGRTSTEKDSSGRYTAALEGVPPGEHTVVVAKTDRREAQTKAKVEAGGTASAQVSLQAAPSEWVELTIEVNQSNSLAILDGELLDGGDPKGGISPGKPLPVRLEQGTHELVVARFSVNPLCDPVVFRQGRWSRQALKAEFKPAKQTGALEIQTTAEGYSLLVDGRELLRRIRGKAILPGIPQGRHTVRIVHPTLGSQAQEVELAVGKIVPVRVSLGGGQPGSELRLVTHPSKATVRVDGKFAGLSDLRLNVPKSGQVQLEITLPGYKPFKKAYAAAELKDTLEITLEKE
jgi:hypothetical protein